MLNVGENTIFAQSLDAMELIGRKQETNELRLVNDSKEPEFVVVYGRRRVGKTFLVNQFFENHFAFKVTGVAERNAKEKQLMNFGEALRRYGSPLCPNPTNWKEAFNSLRILLENLPTKEKQVVFIDELPYMCTRRSDLVSALEHFWNDWACTRDNLLLIVCGSATSWIVKNIIRNKGGLHNRLTRKIYLKPFNLSETRDYLESRGLVFEQKDLLETYMVMGGIPYYLRMLEKGKSLAQNIDEMFFVRKGRLDGEFDNLYAALYEESDQYVKVVRAISKRNRGLTREEIIQETGLSNGGGLSTILADLDQCDIIRSYAAYGKKKKSILYQLTDFYTYFYLKFVEKHNASEKGYWQYQLNTPAQNAWAGYAFELLCLYHYPQIEKKLGITGVQTSVSSWQSKDAQVDLLIDRADRIINLCEIKFWSGEYVITKSYAEELRRKIQSFQQELKTRKAVHLVMVTTYGLKRNEYFNMVQNEVTMEDLFGA